jgi:hypothetical protein
LDLSGPGRGLVDAVLKLQVLQRTTVSFKKDLVKWS